MRRNLHLLVLAGVVGFAVLAGAAPAPAAASPISFTTKTLSLRSSFSSPQEVVVADVDHVNGPDVVVLGIYGDVGVFLNRGNGAFYAPKYKASACSPAESLAVGEFS